MIELVIAGGIGTLLLGAVLIYELVPWELALGIGTWMVAAGMVLGLPAGFYYHVKLRAALKARNALPRRWWLHPTDHHALLRPEERLPVVAWFAAGGLGWVVVVLGCGLAAIGVWRSH